MQQQKNARKPFPPFNTAGATSAAGLWTLLRKLRTALCRAKVCGDAVKRAGSEQHACQACSRQSRGVFQGPISAHRFGASFTHVATPPRAVQPALHAAPTRESTAVLRRQQRRYRLGANIVSLGATAAAAVVALPRAAVAAVRILELEHGLVRPIH